MLDCGDRFRIGCLTLFLAGAISWTAWAAADSSGPNPQRSAQIKTACADLVVQYAYARDRLQYEAYGDLFTHDATFELAGEITSGREALVEALRKRGPSAVTRHVSTPVMIEPLSDNAARGVAYLQLYTTPPNPSGTGPVAHPGPPIVAEYHDTYRIIGDTCRFSSRRIEIVFMPGQPDS